MSKVFACLCMLMLVVSGTAFAVGGEDIGTAAPITVLPFYDNGDTTTFLDDYDEVCSYVSTSPDVVYSYAPPAGVTAIDIELCYSLYDTKVFVYENDATTLVGCNDDYSGCYYSYRSYIGGQPVTTGNTYYIVVDGYGGAAGQYELNVLDVSMAETCDDYLVDLGSMACADTLTYSGDTTGAIDFCGNASGDAHFMFEALEVGDYTVSLCNGATGFDTYMRIYDDACCGNQIAYNDDSCLSVSEVALPGLAAGVYYVHVEGYSANEGVYDLDITCEAEAVCVGPDDCANVLAITPGSYAGDTSGCTDTFPIHSLWGWDLLGNDHVYAIDVPCVESEICVTLTPLDGQDPAVSLATECVDGPVTAIAGSDVGLSGDPEAFCYVTTGDEVGTLYIYVDSYGAGSGGAYTLDVTVTAVANDTCDGAIDISAGGTFTGTNVCAANDYDACIGWGVPGEDVVYSFTVADATNVDLTVTPLDGWDPAIYVVDDCGTLTCYGAADDGYAGDAETLNIDFDCAGTYHLIVDSYYTEGDAWSAGLFDVTAVFTEAAAVDTFDVALVCDPAPLALPAQTRIRAFATNNTAMARQFTGDIAVTLCSGRHIDNLRVGTITVAAGETRGYSWNAKIPAYPQTCDCTLIYDLEAVDSTPCELTGGVPAGWYETDTCGITTICPAN